jgi:hypothetical protein
MLTGTHVPSRSPPQALSPSGVFPGMESQSWEAGAHSVCRQREGPELLGVFSVITLVEVPRKAIWSHVEDVVCPSPNQACSLISTCRQFPRLLQVLSGTQTCMPLCMMMVEGIMEGFLAAREPP